MTQIPLMDFSNLEESLIPQSSKPNGEKDLMLLEEGRKLSRASFHQKSVDEVDIVKMKKFMEAASNGDVKVLQEILNADNSAAVTYKDLSEMTALHFACRYVNKEVVRILLRFYANVNAEDKEKWRPLHYASKYFQRDLSRDLTENYSLKDVESSMNDTRDIIEELCKFGAEINAVDEFGCSALHYAAMRGNSAAAEVLLKYGADPNLHDHNNITPFMTSCTYGTIEVFNILFSESSKTEVDRRKNSALHIAAQHGHIDILRGLLHWSFKGKSSDSLLDQLNNEGKTALQLAVAADHSDAVQELLQKYKGELKTEDERWMLHEAAAKGYKDMCVILIEKAKMKVNLENDEGRLPLHAAAKNNHSEIVKYFLDIEPTAIEWGDNEGFTPLLLAASSDGLETLKVLLERKAKFTISDRIGRNIIFLAAKYNSMRVLQYMLEYMDDKRPPLIGMNSRFRSSSPRDPKTSLKERMMNKTDQNQETAMHCVCGNGYLELVRLLYKHGASITCINEDEETPLHLAAEAGRTNVVGQLLEWEKKLVVAKDDQGRTPLHQSARNGFEETVTLLLNAGSDLHSKNVYDETALDCAIKAGQLAATKVLMDRGAYSTIDEDRGVGTPLHLAAKAGHDSIVQYLLGREVEVGQRDEKGFTALDIAIEGDFKEIARMLVLDKDWDKLMTPSDRFQLPEKSDKPRDTPMRRLIKKFPDVAAIVFDRCITHEAVGGDFGKPFIQHNYEYLEDTWMISTDDKLISSESPFDSTTGKLMPKSVSYSNNYDMIYNNHPLRILVQSGRESLLSHSLVRSLLKHKWNSLGRYIYYTGLTIYCVFISLFTVFISTASAPYNLEIDGHFLDYSFVMSNMTVCEEYKEKHYRPFLLKMCKYTVIVLSTLQLFKEAHQCCTRRIAYFSWENAIELFIYISGLLVVLDFEECSRLSGIREPWQWQLAAISAFFQWLNLLLLVRKLPRFGIYVVMLFDIFKTFARFSLIFVLFVVAFSISFFILLQNRPEFSNVFSSLMKTTVMMIGEFEFTGIFHGDNTEHNQRMYTTAMAYPLFLIFAIVMTILLMNLLVGLAVDDIKGVQEQAALKRLSMQVDLVLQVECNIVGFIRRKVSRGSTSVYSNQKTLWQKFLYNFGSKEISQDSSWEDGAFERDEKEVFLENQLKLQKMSLDNLQMNVDVMYSKQLLMEEMLIKIIDKLK
ncbi:trpa-1 [Pristionchus pacificus]|uniref:Trpa-1 n=1 Tax=Pristionchus pacificus TaxID=54126 RepID=A0A2A6BYI9_PRIPA|nr:trpa-1 [Pristionchus pacificus]|eukprot:PDM70970.1 trpa-1 [Pristionchus pacificus]